MKYCWLQIIMLKPQAQITVQAFGKVKYLSLLVLGSYFIYQGDVLAKFSLERTSYAMYKEPVFEMPTIMTKVM